MSRHGLIEARPGRWLWPVRIFAGVAMLGLAGCGALMSGAPSGRDASPGVRDAGLISRYETLVSRLGADGDAAVRAELAAFSRAHPDLAGPLLNLAMLEAREGREAVALAYLEQAGRVCERCAPVWNELGIIRRRQGDFAAAEAAYQQALAIEPGHALATHNLAVLYDLYLGRPELALELYRQYLAASPDAAGAEKVAAWVADLERRTRRPEKTARAGSGS